MYEIAVGALMEDGEWSGRPMISFRSNDFSLLKYPSLPCGGGYSYDPKLN